MSILKPDGSQLGSSASFSTGSTARIEVSLPSTGTYTIVLDPSSTATGNVKLTAYLGSHVAWLSPLRPETELVAFSDPRLGGPQGYSDIAYKHQQEKATHRPKKTEPQKASVAKQAKPRHHSKASGPSPALRSFHPNAVSAWHPLRTRRGVRGWEAGESPSPWSEVAKLKAPSGTTALAGQALAIDGSPIARVRVSLEDSSLSDETDDAGRFLLEGVPAGHHVLVIDGETAAGKKRYGSYETGVDLANHKTTTLDYTVWLTPLDNSGDQRIDSPTSKETRLTTSRIPGLEVRIPAGTVIRDAAGHAVKNLNISPIPVGRPPFPLPAFVSVPLYFTIQPGRAYLSKGAQIVYPNWGHLPPGQRVDFWNYDPNDRGWYVYGQGSVTPDGKQVMPDPGVKVWEFTGAMITSSPKPPVDGPFPSESTTLGDPVDLYSGLFVYRKTDLTLPDSIPISIQRTYRPRDTNSYSFGTGTTSLYDVRLWSEHNYTEADLIMPDGGRVHYVRTSPGTGYTDAVYEATNTSGLFFGSKITWDPATPGFDVTLTSGLTFIFGELAPLQAIRDQYGNTLTLTRASGQTGNITRITSPHGRWVKLSYDGSNRITEVTDNGGRHVKYTYNSGNLTKVEGPASRTTEYEYDEAGRMKAVINPRGNKYLQVAYDANGRVEKQTTADGAAFKFAYELGEGGKVKATTVTDPLGSQHKATFSTEGFPISETEAPGTALAQTTSFERQPKTGLILSETDPLGRVTDFEYDSSGNVKELTRLAGTEEARTSKFAFEPDTDRLTEATDPLGHTTKYKYGAQGQLLKRIDPLGHETTYEDNPDGQPTAVMNGAGETTKLAYDHGDLSAITDPLGRETRRFVDTLGRVTSITSPGGQQTRYGYNDANQLTSVKTPLGAETAIEYDKDGNPTALIDPRSNKTSRTYDSMDRLESETDPLGRKAEWSYDKAGDLEKATDRNGAVSTYSFDPLRRLTKASYGVSGESAESTVDYEYDEANRLTHVDDSASGEYSIGYDGIGQIEDVEGPNGTVVYAYDAAGRREAMLIPAQEPVEYSFDNADRLTGISRGGESVNLQYDKADRPETITLPDGIQEQYGYDLAGETTSITYKGGKGTLGAIDYAYDPNGQVEAMWGSYARMSLPEALASTKYNADNELIEREGKELKYDKDGNLTSDGANEYTWDARGQLTGIGGGSSASFSYDPFGKRIAKTLGGTTTDLLYDGFNPVQESIEGSVTASMLTGLEPDQLFSRTTERGSDSYLTDQLGSTVALANSSEEPKTTYTYDPFGSTTESGEESDNPFQFTGRESDGTGLQYNRARYYSPANARFISQDPAGFAGSGPNLYWYAGGDPVDFTDPSGESIGDWPGGGPSTNSGPTFPFPFEPSPIFATPPSDQPNFDDPSQPPSEDWEWRGSGPPGSRQGSWYNPSENESLHPDLEHGPPQGPHYDHVDKDGKKARLYPDGRYEPKKNG
jgi:RHS repeat-associated protein